MGDKAETMEPVCRCKSCGTPVYHQGDWGFDEEEHEPTCLECGAFLDLPEGY